jgi:hypothetical protein
LSLPPFAVNNAKTIDKVPLLNHNSSFLILIEKYPQKEEEKTAYSQKKIVTLQKNNHDEK